MLADLALGNLHTLVHRAPSWKGMVTQGTHTHKQVCTRCLRLRLPEPGDLERKNSGARCKKQRHLKPKRWTPCKSYDIPCDHPPASPFGPGEQANTAYPCRLHLYLGLLATWCDLAVEAAKLIFRVIHYNSVKFGQVLRLIGVSLRKAKLSGKPTGHEEPPSTFHQCPSQLELRLFPMRRPTTPFGWCQNRWLQTLCQRLANFRLDLGVRLWVGGIGTECYSSDHHVNQETGVLPFSSFTESVQKRIVHIYPQLLGV